MTRRHQSLPPQTARLGAGRQWALYALVAVLVATGAAWLAVHLRAGDDALPSPLEPWMMKLHGAAAMLTIYLAGSMLQGHMVNAWQRHRNRWSGGLTAFVFLLLALSGYGLYYFNGEALRRATEWLHWVIGFGSPAMLVVHMLFAPPRAGSVRAHRFLRSVRWRVAVSQRPAARRTPD
jgi:hypothetical protein